MKVKITDLMDLYEDRHCPLTSLGQETHAANAEKETIALKEKKHAFGWKEGLCLAAVLVLVVLGGFGLKRLLDRNSSLIPGESGTVQTAPIPQSSETPVSSTEPRPTGFDPVPETEWAEMSRLATALAQQGIIDLDSDLDEEYELISFAHIYTKIHQYADIVFRDGGDGSYETLTLEQVNGTLDRLFGKTVSPAEDTDYTLQRGENYAQHESFRDGCFWWPAADGEIRTRFAVLSAVINATEQDYTLAFEVFEADLNRWPDFADWDPVDLEAIRGFHEDGKLRDVGSGTMTVLRRDSGLTVTSFRITRFETIQMPDEPLDPETEAAFRALFEDPTGWYSRALSSSYADPADVDLYELFYDGLPNGEWATDEELKALYPADAFENGHFMGPGVDRLPPAEMDKVLQQYFGLSLEQSSKRGLKAFQYAAENDCYYHCHGDTNQQLHKVVDARRLEDGTLVFTYTSEYGNYAASEDFPSVSTAALRPDGEGGYQLLSNLPGEWVTTDKLGALGALYRLEDRLQGQTSSADGGTTLRELRFSMNNQFRYLDGDAESGYDYWAWGEWWLEDAQSFHCLLCQTKEDGNRIGPWNHVIFDCSFRDGELVLVQTSETGFRDDAPGTVIRFRIVGEP